MSKIKNLIFFSLFILLVDCSFDDKSGIWSETKKEKKRISELEKKQKKIKNVDIIYSSKDVYSKEIPLSRNINISNPKKTLSWNMSGLNHQNFLGNIYLSGIDNVFLKKKNWKE